MVSFLSAARNTLLNLTFPQRCHSCANQVDDDRLGVACSDCWGKTTLFNNFEELCPKCGAKSSFSGVAAVCRNCTDQHFDTARSIGLYETALSAAILHLKRHPVIPKVLLDRMPEVISHAAFADCDLIIPVPLSAKRLAERGFNQAECIADQVARVVRKPVDSGSLARKGHTPMHRASMDRKAREQSVKNAFEVVRPRLINGKSILLVDDIFTSGATVSNSARALKRKGASCVNVLTLARTHQVMV